MDFIERLLEIAPDGGDGSLESLLFALLIIGLIGVLLMRAALRRPIR